MRTVVLVSSILMVAGLAGCIGDEADVNSGDASTQISANSAADDVVVVAVIDWGINPYHWDFLAEHMPQHMDNDSSNDLPLDRPPHEWIPGFPDPETFDSYTGMNLTLTPDNAYADPSCDDENYACRDGDGLYQRDEHVWENVTKSNGTTTNFHYIPGTKVVGFLNYAREDIEDTGFATGSHGVGSSSVSVGNYHGTCPNCVFVFVNIPTDASEAWVREQSWIDASSHSYGASTLPLAGAVRDGIDACDPSGYKESIERGQQRFVSAGNGITNTFSVPQSTFVNCDSGPDWPVTVGAVHPATDNSYTGSSKPAEVSSYGSSYPSAGPGSVSDESTFSGTSNAGPVVMGTYAQALYNLRSELPGASTMQHNGTIAEGPAGCGDANPECALSDGKVTVHEMREALFRTAEPSGLNHVVGVVGLSVSPENQELEFMSEGHGVLHGRLGGPDEPQRIVDYVAGEWTEEVDPALNDWMVAHSWCVQQVWGTWDHGYWREGMEVPAADPSWPMRSWIGSEACPMTTEAIVAASFWQYT